MAMAASMSSSGEMTAFGTAGGYLHLWASSETPRVNHYSRPTAFATLPQEVRPSIFGATGLELLPSLTIPRNSALL
jgi:hypothetical protein